MLSASEDESSPELAAETQQYVPASPSSTVFIPTEANSTSPKSLLNGCAGKEQTAEERKRQAQGILGLQGILEKERKHQAQARLKKSQVQLSDNILQRKLDSTEQRCEAAQLESSVIKDQLTRQLEDLLSHEARNRVEISALKRECREKDQECRAISQQAKIAQTQSQTRSAQVASLENELAEQLAVMNLMKSKVSEEVSAVQPTVPEEILSLQRAHYTRLETLEAEVSEKSIEVLALHGRNGTLLQEFQSERDACQSKIEKMATASSIGRCASDKLDVLQERHATLIQELQEERENHAAEKEDLSIHTSSVVAELSVMHDKHAALLQKSDADLELQATENAAVATAAAGQLSAAKDENAKLLQELNLAREEWAKEKNCLTTHTSSEMSDIEERHAATLQKLKRHQRELQATEEERNAAVEAATAGQLSAAKNESVQLLQELNLEREEWTKEKNCLTMHMSVMEDKHATLLQKLHADLEAQVAEKVAATAGQLSAAWEQNAELLQELNVEREEWAKEKNRLTMLTSTELSIVEDRHATLLQKLHADLELQLAEEERIVAVATAASDQLSTAKEENARLLHELDMERQEQAIYFIEGQQFAETQKYEALLQEFSVEREQWAFERDNIVRASLGELAAVEEQHVSILKDLQAEQVEKETEIETMQAQTIEEALGNCHRLFEEVQGRDRGSSKEIVALRERIRFEEQTTLVAEEEANALRTETLAEVEAIRVHSEAASKEAVTLALSSHEVGARHQHSFLLCEMEECRQVALQRLECVSEISQAESNIQLQCDELFVEAEGLRCQNGILREELNRNHDFFKADLAIQERHEEMLAKSEELCRQNRALRDQVAEKAHGNDRSFSALFSHEPQVDIKESAARDQIQADRWQNKVSDVRALREQMAEQTHETDRSFSALFSHEPHDDGKETAARDQIQADRKESAARDQLIVELREQLADKCRECDALAQQVKALLHDSEDQRNSSYGGSPTDVRALLHDLEDQSIPGSAVLMVASPSGTSAGLEAVQDDGLPTVPSLLPAPVACSGFSDLREQIKNLKQEFRGTAALISQEVSQLKDAFEPHQRASH